MLLVATPIRQVGRFRKICERFTVFARRARFQERKRNLPKKWRKTNYIYGILTENKLTICHLPFCFLKRLIKKFDFKNACAMLALYINRFAFRFIVADKSGRQIAACKLALREVH